MGDLMKKNMFVQMLIGFLIGVIATILGSIIYLELFIHYNLFSNFEIILKSKNLGRIIAIGSLLNLAVFTILIKKRQDLKARGSVLAIIVLTIITLFL